MKSLDFKLDKQLFNFLITRKRIWPLLDGFGVYASPKNYYFTMNMITLTNLNPNLNEYIFLDDDLNCYAEDDSKYPEKLLIKLKDGSIQKELKSHILKYGINYNRADLKNEKIKNSFSK